MVMPTLTRDFEDEPECVRHSGCSALDRAGSADVADRLPWRVIDDLP
jgi:hypothetical protein